ncbi:Beta-1,3-galactosyltransferase 1 [Frankliniella fusca]|uniref:Hexosyltransferase n=1 Tax=Frankliniella fusca TaxID=407009 RepID=A0AAE1LDG8_9NEOP|nr:Beta-1,3-galactosyltransferase 1 [Frankliniella fusca]
MPRYLLKFKNVSYVKCSRFTSLFYCFPMGPPSEMGSYQIHVPSYELLYPPDMAITTTGTSICHRLSKLLSINRKLFIFILVLLALFYIPAYHQLAQPRSHDEELDGWPRNGTREVRLFIQPENVTTIISPNFCEGRQPFLLVVVCSAVQNSEARKAIRETWASSATSLRESNRSNEVFPDPPKEVFVVFLLGDPDNTTLQSIIEEESRRFGDIVQEGFIDSYNNLTVKSVMLLKWVTQRCSSALYVMKTDDDTMVNLQSLRLFLKAQQSALAKPRAKKVPLLVGNLICGARPILDSTHKWYMPRYIYAGRTYPNYLSGSGYVMSQEVVQALYEASQKVSLIPLEDVYITGQCAVYSGIRPTGHPGFSLGKRPMSTCSLGNPQVITTHRLNPKELREAWDLSRMSTALCNKTVPSATPAAATQSFLRGSMFGRKQRHIFNSRRNGLGCY